MLSEFATRACDSMGREREEAPCPMRTAFARDRDRILHCKSFRRLKHKTQVFLAPEGDHYRTRLTHTLEVSQIARTISRCLRLNEDLTEAIALGHDLGHTPFGHAGERVLNEVTGHFEHNEQSLRVVEELEGGKGLNLTVEVRDGIAKHKKAQKPMTPEGMVVNIADRIAYINHDIDDALRAGIIDAIPAECADALGRTQRERINLMIGDVVACSEGSAEICMSRNVDEMTERLRQFMFDSVYCGSAAKAEEGNAERIVRLLYAHYTDNPGDMGEGAAAQTEKYGPVQTVTDYIAGMTDRFAVRKFMDIYIPKGWNKF